MAHGERSEQEKARAEERLRAKMVELRAKHEPKLWTSAALSPHGNEYGLTVVMAPNREAAIEKISAALGGASDGEGYVPRRRYLDNLRENVAATLAEVPEGVVIDFSPAEKRG